MDEQLSTVDVGLMLAEVQNGPNNGMLTVGLSLTTRVLLILLAGQTSVTLKEMVYVPGLKKFSEGATLEELLPVTKPLSVAELFRQDHAPVFTADQL